MARPTGYYEAIGIEIAARLAEGATLKQIAADDAMPSMRTILRWVSEHPEFEHRYVVAQHTKASVILDQVIDIVDETVTDNAQASRQRNRAEYRLRVAQMLNPAKYAQRLGVGAAPELPPLDAPQTKEQMIEVARRMAFVLARGDHLLKEQAAPTPEPLLLKHEPLERVDLHGDPMPPSPSAGPQQPAAPSVMVDAPSRATPIEDDAPFNCEEQGRTFESFVSPWKVLRHRP